MQMPVLRPRSGLAAVRTAVRCLSSHHPTAAWLCKARAFGKTKGRGIDSPTGGGESPQNGGHTHGRGGWEARLFVDDHRRARCFGCRDHRPVCPAVAVNTTGQAGSGGLDTGRFVRFGNGIGALSGGCRPLPLLSGWRAACIDLRSGGNRLAGPLYQRNTKRWLAASVFL